MSKILVTDDDPNILKMVEKLLVHIGHQVFVANDAFKAMELLSQYDMDLLISDANMPHCSGFDLIKSIKNEKRYVNLSVIMMTGRRERKDIAKALSIGVDDYIVKPIIPEIFLEKITQLFNKKPTLLPLKVKAPSQEAPQVAFLKQTIDVINIDDYGISFVSKSPIKTGVTVDLELSVFTSFGSPVPKFKVTNTTKSNNEEWEVKVMYIDPNDDFLNKVRTYIVPPNVLKNSA